MEIKELTNEVLGLPAGAQDRLLAEVFSQDKGRVELTGPTVRMEDIPAEQLAAGHKIARDIGIASGAKTFTAEERAIMKSLDLTEEEFLNEGQATKLSDNPVYAALGLSDEDVSRYSDYRGDKSIVDRIPSD